MLASRTHIVRSLRAAGRRHASSTPAGPAQYEGFATPFWGKVGLLAFSGILFSKFAPDAEQGFSFSHWVNSTNVSREEVLEANAIHTVLAQELSESNHLIKEATREPIRRLRYASTFEQRSPFSAPVGATVDVSNVVVKSNAHRSL